MYRKLKAFGKPENRYSNQEEAILICAPDSAMDTGFRHGGATSAINQYNSETCQLYFANTCSTHWNDTCEAIYQGSHQKGRPSVASYTKYFHQPSAYRQELTDGQQLLQSSAVERFCRFENFTSTTERVGGIPIQRHVPSLGARIVCDQNLGTLRRGDKLSDNCMSDRSGACDIVFANMTEQGINAYQLYQ